MWHTNRNAKKNWNIAVEVAWILFITTCLYFFLPVDKNNRLFPYSNNIHFRNKVKCKSSLVKRSLICMRIKKHSHINSFAKSLTLQARIHTGFHRFTEIGQIFHKKLIFNNKNFPSWNLENGLDKCFLFPISENLIPFPRPQWIRNPGKRTLGS